MENQEGKKSKTGKMKVKRPKSVVSSEEDISNELVIVDEPMPALKPKLQTVTKMTPNALSSATKKRKKRDSGSSDEERWLTAIESGKLEDVDEELKKIKPKDPALMTARQRAMYDRGVDGSPQGAPTLMSLPTGYKEKVMTAEAIQKAAIKSQKRKQLADEKREKDKKKTMERLLKKQESKIVKSAKRVTRSSAPSIIYKQNVESTTLLFPEGFEFPIVNKVVGERPQPKYCAMECGNLKRYACSQTGVPLCSLECYKRNISSRIL